MLGLLGARKVAKKLRRRSLVSIGREGDVRLMEIARMTDWLQLDNYLTILLE